MKWFPYLKQNIYRNWFLCIQTHTHRHTTQTHFHFAVFSITSSIALVINFWRMCAFIVYIIKQDETNDSAATLRPLLIISIPFYSPISSKGKYYSGCCVVFVCQVNTRFAHRTILFYFISLFAITILFKIHKHISRTHQHQLYATLFVLIKPLIPQSNNMPAQTHTHTHLHPHILIHVWICVSKYIWEIYYIKT